MRIGRESERCAKIPWGSRAPCQSPTLRCGGPGSILGGMLFLFYRITDNGYGSGIPLPFTTITEPSACIISFQVLYSTVNLWSSTFAFLAWSPVPSSARLYTRHPPVAIRSPFLFLFLSPHLTFTLTPPCPRAAFTASATRIRNRPGFRLSSPSPAS